MRKYPASVIRRPIMTGIRRTKSFLKDLWQLRNISYLYGNTVYSEVVEFSSFYAAKNRGFCDSKIGATKTYKLVSTYLPFFLFYNLVSPREKWKNDIKRRVKRKKKPLKLLTNVEILVSVLVGYSRVLCRSEYEERRVVTMPQCSRSFQSFLFFVCQ